jgi:hypothetical protein
MFSGRLKRLWHRPPAIPAAAPSPPPAPTQLPSSPSGSNPIHDLLDAWQLPWREPRHGVEARAGIRPHPFYGWDVVVIDDAVPLTGLLTPWNASVSTRFAPDQPITEFDATVSVADDAHRNVQQAHDHLARHLGPAEIGKRYNTVGCEWRCGAAAVTLTAWPPAWQSSSATSDAHAAEPRLVTACSIHVQTGFRPVLSEREAAWLADFQSARVAVDALPVERMAAAPPAQTLLEFVREPAAHLPRVHGQLGHAPGRAALIFCTDQLFVIAHERIESFDVDRLLPAKGGGGASLMVRCRPGYAGSPSKRISLRQVGEPDGLNELGTKLAAMFEVPVEIAPYEYDA